MSSLTEDLSPMSPEERAHALGLPDDSSLVNHELAGLMPYTPGRPWRDVAAELGIAPEALVMLAANENVLGPSPKALEAMIRHAGELHLYPDGGAQKLRQALAERWNLTPAHVAVGNGSNELIDLLVRTFVSPGETVVTAWPSFVVYRLSAQAAGREILWAPLRADRYDLAALAGLVDRRTKLVFIANPNNPTGTYVTRRAVTAFLDRIPRSVIVVLDEAYGEFVDADDCAAGVRDFFNAYPRLVVLRTFSKAYGLAGLRIGYGLMDPRMVAYLDCVRQPYNVSAAAQAAALAAMEDVAHLETGRRLVRDGRLELERGFARMGLNVVPSQANFILLRLSNEAAPLVRALRQAGILVRDMRGYDMPNTVRITVGTREMNLKVLEAVEQHLAHKR